ncbi:TPA: hypothetical protein ACGSTL_001309 [Vibrio parahaemolyticus]|uniref:hypothetical protein n=1 Tax=Vibrio campbellii TaxID=680 RepID=UPI001F0764F9|nr:hypothetical protein [Vibrio campbellii]UMM06754.1 hypothetical protein MKR81_26200 [Vibrio campbellii]
MVYNLFETADAKGINTAVTKVVHASPLPAEYRKAIENTGLCQPSRCFDNSWSIVREKVIPGAQYALVLGVRVLPVEHAIICVNGKYYDPTWEMFLGGLGKDYLVIDQWDCEELLEVAKLSLGKDGGLYPPMLRNLERSTHFKNLFKD